MQLTAFCYLSMNTSANGVVTLAPDLNVNLVRIRYGHVVSVGIVICFYDVSRVTLRQLLNTFSRLRMLS